MFVKLRGLIQVFIIDEQRTYEVIALYEQCLRQQAYGRGNCGFTQSNLFGQVGVYNSHKEHHGQLKEHVQLTAVVVFLCSREIMRFATKKR